VEGALDRREIARALDACPDPALLIDPGPGLRIIDLNQAFCEAAMVEAEQVIGERLFAAFPANPDGAGADGIVNLYASLRRAASTGKAHAMDAQRYDIRDGDGRFVPRRWRMLNIPIFSKGGRLLYLLHQVEDVTTFAAAPPREARAFGGRAAAP
jgi:PAS domain-containing protein